MGEKKVIKAALLGAGTVGSGVYALSEMLKDEMFQKTGANLEIKKVLVRNTKKERPGIPKEVLTDNWKEILEDDEIQLVIELMGGVEPARTYIVEALEIGKQVVTAEWIIRKRSRRRRNLATRRRIRRLMWKVTMRAERSRSCPPWHSTPR